MKVIVRILHLPSDMQSGLYEATGTLFVSEENKNNDFIQQFQQSISPYSVYALLYHPRHKDALFLRVFSFDLKENSASLWLGCYFCFLRVQKVFPLLHITQIACLMADGVF